MQEASCATVKHPPLPHPVFNARFDIGIRLFPLCGSPLPHALPSPMTRRCPHLFSRIFYARVPFLPLCVNDIQLTFDIFLHKYPIANRKCLLK